MIRAMSGVQLLLDQTNSQKLMNMLCIKKSLDRIAKASSMQVVKDGSTIRYIGTIRLNFLLEVWLAGVERFFCNGTDAVRWYRMPFL